MCGVPITLSSGRNQRNSVPDTALLDSKADPVALLDTTAEGTTMDTTRHVIIEEKGKTLRTTLREPATLMDLWALFCGRGIRPVITLSKGVARVNLDGADLFDLR